jgi:2-dehydro-3-deoxy-D-arabinonate dehydratase
VRIRRDSRWSVPEPELALVLSPRLRLVGFTIGNDMSSRDIEGENPLYLPQAKVYQHSCALGPVVTLAESMPPLAQVSIRLVIDRGGKTVFDGSTSVGEMKRTPDDLIKWLGRDNSFPAGAVLLTGTGIVPPDDFTLAPDDRVSIDIGGIGRLTNFVEQI